MHKGFRFRLFIYKLKKKREINKKRLKKKIIKNKNPLARYIALPVAFERKETRESNHRPSKKHRAEPRPYIPVLQPLDYALVEDWLLEVDEDEGDLGDSTVPDFGVFF